MADWKTALKGIAPTLATALMGPLAGIAVKTIGDAMGMPEPTLDGVKQAIQNGSMTADHLVAIRQADDALKVRLQELGLDLARLNATTEAGYLADVQDARKTMGRDSGVFWLGIAILLTFAATMGAVLWGSFLLLTGGITLADVATVAAVAGLIGSVVGYVAANAQQVVGYFYGSSQGSKAKTDALASAVSGVRGAQ